jgi:hypothetical protein
MKIYKRSEWGARHAAGVGAAPMPAQRVWLHHTAGRSGAVRSSEQDDFQLLRELEDIGQSRFGRGISYSFVVTRSGRVFEGTGPGRVGTHTRGQNTAADAIVLTGNYQNIEPTDDQLRAVADLLAYGAQQRWWREPKLAGGHQDAPGAATACPGRNLVSRVAEVNARASGQHSASAAIPPAASPQPRPVLRQGSRGAHVLHLQRQLGRRNPYFRWRNGIFGPQTAAEVRAHQRHNGLAVDGIVGPLTWASLER